MKFKSSPPRSFIRTPSPLPPSWQAAKFSCKLSAKVWDSVIAPLRELSGLSSAPALQLRGQRSTRRASGIQVISAGQELPSLRAFWPGQAMGGQLTHSSWKEPRAEPSPFALLLTLLQSISVTVDRWVTPGFQFPANSPFGFVAGCNCGRRRLTSAAELSRAFDWSEVKWYLRTPFTLNVLCNVDKVSRLLSAYYVIPGQEENILTVWLRSCGGKRKNKTKTVLIEIYINFLVQN